MEGGWRQNYQRYKSYFLNVVSQYQKRADVRVYLEILLSLITISAFAIFAIKPTFTTIAELIKEIEGKENTLATMETKVENLEKAQALYDQEAQRIELLKIAVPDSPSPDVFARQIEGLSGSHQVTLTTEEVEEVVLSGATENKSSEDNPLPEKAGGLSFSFNIEAEYQPLFNFLSDFELLRRPSFLNLVQIRTSETEEGRQIVLTIQGSAPYYQSSDKDNSQ